MAGIAFIQAALIIVLIFKSVLVVKEHQRGVCARLGRFKAMLGPGLHLIVPFFDVVKIVDLNEKIPGWQGYSEQEILKRVKELVLANMK